MNEMDLMVKIAKLPAWAQQHIAKLKTDVMSLKRERNETNAGESLIWWSPDYLEKHYVPSRATVTLSLPLGELEFDLRDGEIRVYSSGECYPYVSPDSANTFVIGLKARI